MFGARNRSRSRARSRPLIGLAGSQLSRLWRKFFVPPVNVMMESDGSVFLHPRSEIEQVNRQRPLQLDPALAPAGDQICQCCRITTGLQARHQLSEVVRSLEPNAAMAEVTTRARKQVIRRRVMQVDVILVRKYELEF